MQVLTQYLTDQLDYPLNWSTWLAASNDGDTISAVTWSVTPTGLTISATSHTSTMAVVWLTGGTPGHTYTVNCQITTANGRAANYPFELTVLPTPAPQPQTH